MTEGGPFQKVGVRRYRALRRYPCPAPGPWPSPGRRWKPRAAPYPRGDDGRGAIWEDGCSSTSGVESVSMPRPWAPAFAGATVETEGCAVSAPPAHRHRTTTRDRRHPSEWASGVHTWDGRATFTLRVVRGLWSGLYEPHLVVPRSASLVGSLPGSAASVEKECSWAYSPPFARRSLCLPVSVTRP